MQPLPIDPLLPDVTAALRQGRSLVIEAPPGAGKTTRVPRALLESGLTGTGEVLVLEPRRLAARLAARRVAEELGERLGETVGYQVRYEEVAGPRTRLRFVTEGLLTRRLLSEPNLPGVGAVVLDEFHERHLQGDLALALLRRLQRTSRPDLILAVMSATLDAGPVAAFLEAPSLRSEGRLFEVAVEYQTPAEAARPDRRLEGLVASAVRRLVADGLDGDVLVFLPGASEIRRAMEACAPIAGSAGLEVLPLHGDLPPEEQDRAVLPGRRRKVILSTNVAETSVTIENVVAVVDSGLARIASHSPWSGLPTLEVRKVSRASAAQRAGRAGRTRPGRALRLYTQHDHDSRPEFELPEIRREDLAEPLLALASLGALEGFLWFELPPAAAEQTARALLTDLGALARTGQITDLGRRMLRLPLHPRLARLVLEAENRGLGQEGALLAALLGERDIRERWDRNPRSATPTGPSDLLELASLFEEAARARFAPERLRAMGLSVGSTMAVERSRKQIVKLIRPRQQPPKSRSSDLDEPLLLATLAAYPDRVARRRAPGSSEVVLAGGGSAKLDEQSVVREAPLLVAVDAEERRATRRGSVVESGRAVVRLASAVTHEMLLDLFPDDLRFEERLVWNPEGERVEGWEQLLFRDLVLEETRTQKLSPESVTAVLAEAARAKGIRAFAEEGALERLLARIELVARLFPESGLTVPSEEELAAALGELCTGRRSFAELRQAGIEEAVLGRLDPRQRALLSEAAPERLTLPGGRSARVHYERGETKPPYLESRLQDFFGMARGPTLARGRLPVVLHLLAPNQRAVQVTTDLAGFWERHYPALRRELMRRYPRHAWPEDPLHAQPPSPRRR